MAKLFGFSIEDKEKKSKGIVSPVPQNNEDGVDNYINRWILWFVCRY